MLNEMTSVKPKDTRATLVRKSAELFRRRGYAGTGLKAILAASDAPFGSLYHFFPGGKEELGVAALEAGGTTYRELVEAIFAHDVDVATATRTFFVGAAAVLEETDYADACPIATIALEVASTSEPMRLAASEAFESWLAVLRARFVAAGIAPVRARALAVELFCLVEGAFLLCRAKRDTEALLTTCELAVTIVEDALPAPS
jgi:TetR/AcrR family transcriptional regulator, lmrAB and yxaGH operons repressor